jgi:hypothetical protein
MKLIASMMVSVEGVYQGPKGPGRGPERRSRPRRWAHVNDEEGGCFLSSMFERADALFLGRRTWENFEGTGHTTTGARATWPRTVSTF